MRIFLALLGLIIFAGACAPPPAPPKIARDTPWTEARAQLIQAGFRPVKIEVGPYCNADDRTGCGSERILCHAGDACEHLFARMADGALYVAFLDGYIPVSRPGGSDSRYVDLRKFDPKRYEAEDLVALSPNGKRYSHLGWSQRVEAWARRPATELPAVKPRQPWPAARDQLIKAGLTPARIIEGPDCHEPDDTACGTERISCMYSREYCEYLFFRPSDGQFYVAWTDGVVRGRGDDSYGGVTRFDKDVHGLEELVAETPDGRRVALGPPHPR